MLVTILVPTVRRSLLGPLVTSTMLMITSSCIYAYGLHVLWKYIHILASTPWDTLFISRTKLHQHGLSQTRPKWAHDIWVSLWLFRLNIQHYVFRKIKMTDYCNYNACWEDHGTQLFFKYMVNIAFFLFFCFFFYILLMLSDGCLYFTSLIWSKGCWESTRDFRGVAVDIVIFSFRPCKLPTGPSLSYEEAHKVPTASVSGLWLLTTQCHECLRFMFPCISSACGLKLPETISS